MRANYRPFVSRMIEKYEGGYGWDRGDAGGPTKYGITCYDLAEHRGEVMHSMSAWAPLVRDMQLSEAEDIYAAKYAKGIRFDDLKSGIDVVMMDYAVNSGIGRAILVARRITKTEAPGMNNGLVLAINSYDAKDFINTMCDERMIFLKGLWNWHIFKNGWTSRVADLRTYALALVNKKARPEEVDVPKVPKGTHIQPTGPTASTGGASTGIGGLVSYIFGSPWWFIALILVVGALATAAWLYYRKKTEKLADETVVLPSDIQGDGLDG